ncbi:MAG: NADH:ubiquinone reductase (Na(+)-transporting) subunit C [Saprospiraceae bacterium]|nr:NADH:ubiquinone reductase (Na(+)-transporting) subunit C [Saprospiraceae bacterium]
MHSTNYIIRFVLIMTTLAAIVLAALNTVLGEQHAKNEKVYNKRAILAAVKDHLEGTKKLEELSDKEVDALFTNNIKQVVLDMNGKVQEGMSAENIDMGKERKKPEAERMLPFYIYTNSAGKPFYILSIRGNGLWDEIWGSISLEEDLKTIAGASFDHKGETPGLGAEIKDNPSFPSQFTGKTIYNEQGEYTSVVVKKGAATNPTFEVDGISGATVTGNGVSEMLQRGIKYYEPYLNSLKTKS